MSGAARFPGARAAAALPLLCAACSSVAHEAAGASGAGESVRRTSACAAESLGAVRTALDVAYVTRGGRPLRLDVAWPARPGPHPLVVLLHGGGWSGGSRASLHGEMRALAQRGYAAATVEYRLTSAPRDVFPAAAADTRCAVRFLRARAADYGVDVRRVAAAGYSAGGHLASLLGTAPHEAALDAEPCGAGAGDASVAAVVSYAGPQDLRVNGPYTREQADLVTNFLGAFPGDAPAHAALASPIAHVRQGAPPFLLVHGTRDELVPVAHARRMAAALRAVGTPATVVERRGEGHGFVGLGASADDTVRCTTLAFLARWIGPGAAAGGG